VAENSENGSGGQPDTARPRGISGTLVVAVAALGLLLSGCGQREEILPGERLDLRDASGRVNQGISEPLDGIEAPETAGVADAENQSLPFVAPTQVSHNAWTHKNGSAAHFAEHPALSAAPELFWSADIGSGNSRKYQITADPVIAAGRIFTMDSRSIVVATSVSGGRLWSQDMTPGFDRNEGASGGGLALNDGILFVTTGFGTLSALNTENGELLWTQRLEGAASAAPTVYGDLVYVVSRDGKAWAVDKNDGRVRWRLPGLPSESGVSGGGSPAVNDRVALFPYASGDLVASFPRGGVRLWAASLAGQRRGRVYAEITDITGDPVIDGDVVYAGSSSGRIAAISLQSGERIWTVTDGAMSPVWPAGGSVFAVSDQSELLRLDAATGERIWGIQLPHFTARRAKRNETIYPHFGPVLAGGRLLVASGDGKLRAFAPEDGSLMSETALPGGAAGNMAVVDGVLYVVSTRGQLHAYR